MSDYTLTRPTTQEYIKIDKKGQVRIDYYFHLCMPGKTWPLCGSERDSVFEVRVASEPPQPFCCACAFLSGMYPCVDNGHCCNATTT